MNIRILTCNSFYAGVSEIARQVAYETKNFFKKVKVIVPDKFSFFMEKEILKNVDSYFNVEVLGLNYLCKSVTKELDCVSSLKQNLLIRKSIAKTCQDFEYFPQENLSQSFYSGIQTAVNLLMANDLAPCDVALAGEEPLDKKYRDISRIFDEYKNQLGDTLDQNSLFKKASEILCDNNYFKDTSCFFVGFDDLTKQGLGLLLQCAKSCDEFSVFCQKPDDLQKNNYLYGCELFNKIKRLFEDEKLNFELENIYSDDEKIKTILTEKNFKNNQTFYFAKPSQEETQYEIIAREIYCLIRFKNVKTNQISVACGNLQEENENIKNAFEKYNIPFYLDCNKKIINSFSAIYFSSLLNAYKNNFSLNDILELIELNQNINNDEKIKQKEIIYKYYINLNEEKQFFQVLNDLEINSDEFKKIFNFIKITKEKIESNNFLDLFDENFKANLIYFCDGFKDEKKEFENNSFQALFNMIECVCEVYKNEQISFQDYFDIFSDEIKKIELRDLPISFEDVFVGDIAESFFEKKDYMFCTNQTTIEVFRENSESSVVKDSDILALKKICVISPSVVSVNGKLRAKTLYNFLQFKNSVYVFCPLTAKGQAKCEPSLIFNYIKDKSNSVNLLDDYSYLHLADENFKNNPALLTRLFADEKSIMVVLGKIKNVESLNSVYNTLLSFMQFVNDEEQIVLNALDVKLSATLFETYFKCPYLCFVKYFLRLKEFEPNELSPRTIGSLFHYVFENFYKDFINDKSINIDKKISFYFNDYVSKNLKTLSKDKYKFVYKRMEKNFKKFANLCVEENKSCVFAPLEMEKFFKMEKFAYDAPFVGFIDRVDCYEDRYRIIDYKTGEIDDSTLALFYGLKLQLFLYSLCFENLPDAVLYANIKEIFSGDYKTLYKGFVVGDPTLQDANLIATGKSKLIPVSGSTSAGEFVAKQTTHKISEDEFKNMQHYAEKVCQVATSRMKNGEFIKSPIMEDKDPYCKKCAFFDMCGGGEGRQKISAKNFSASDVFAGLATKGDKE